MAGGIIGNFLVVIFLLFSIYWFIDIDEAMLECKEREEKFI